MDAPFVSIIVPVRNMERTIGKTFEYLMNVEYPRDRWEIVFADGGSTDNTIPIIRNYQNENPFIKLIEIQDCPSPGYARTQALQHAEGEYVFFTDGDCAPCRSWIHKTVEIFRKDEKIGAVGGEIYTLRVDPENLVEIYCEAFGFNRVAWRYGNLQEGYFPQLDGCVPTEICGHQAYFFVTANVAYRRQAIEDAERRFWELPTGEDMDFGLRVRKKGWKFYFLPQAGVEHMHRADLKALLKVWQSYGQAHPPLLREHAANFMEIIFQFIGQYPQHPLIRFPFPVKGFMFIGNFHLMHLYAVIFLATFLLQWAFLDSVPLRIVSWISAAGMLYTAFQYFKTCFNIQPYYKWREFAKMKYLTNLKFIIGGLKGSRIYKTFCVEPSF